MNGASTGGTRPILIVDDDRDIRETLCELLEDRGFAVVTAATGADALRLLRAGEVRPSLILLDLMMPVVDGYGFLAAQRADPLLAGLPVAVITAGHGVDQERIGPGVLVLRKPMHLRELLAIVGQMIEDGARA